MSSKSFFSYTRTLLPLLLLPGSLGLRDVHMVIPEATERGKPVVIRFMYELENEDLYQVKWYKGDKEFCRYSPSEVPPLKIFPIRGIEVDRERSDAQQLTISAATRTAQGRYVCEVSVAPTFLTAQVLGFMYVVDLPKSYPDLIWMKRRYKLGMKIKAECISYDSMPPANLSFFINSEPALPQHVWQKVSGGKNGLWTAHSTLQFVLQEHHLTSLKIRIRCAASIYSIYHKSHEQVADAETVTTTTAPVTHGALHGAPTQTQQTTLYPLQSTSKSSASSVVCSVSVMFFVCGVSCRLI